MKRTSITKSGSTATSSTATTFIPPYQPISLLLSNKENAQETNSIYNILQESKSANSNNNKNSLSQTPSYLGVKNSQISSSSSSQNLYSQQSAPKSPNQMSSQNLNSTTKASESLLQHNQRLLMSTQKTGSLHSTSSLLCNYSSANNNQTSSTSKSPLSHSNISVYRAQTQYTPTSKKQILSTQNGISPKILLTGGGIQGSKSSQMFHSHRPSLAAAQTNNENISLQKQQSLSKASEVVKKNINQNLDYQQTISNSYGIQNSISGISSTLPYLAPNLATSGFNSNELTQNQSAINNNNNNYINAINNSDVHFESVNFYSNQLSTERSVLRTPKSPQTLPATNNTNQTNPNVNGSVSSKSNLQFIFNTTNQTQNTDIDGNNTDTTQMMNISQLSAITNANNTSTNNLTDRNLTQTEQNKSNDIPESTTKDFYYQKCSNHPDKKAKYVICNSQNGNNIYCSKCAIQFSKDGFQPIHILDFNSQQQQKNKNQQLFSQQDNHHQENQEIETSAKLAEIVSFLNKINSQSEKWYELNHALQIKKKDVNNFYEKQLSKIDQQYQGLIEMISKLREQAVQNLNTNKERSMQIYKIKEKETNENLSDFVNIKTDIENNTDKIVNLIQMDDFIRIMNSYKEKFYKMTEFFSSISSEFIDLAKFKAPNANQFYQQFEQLFEVGSFSTTLVKKRVSEFINIKRSQQQQQILSNTSLQQSIQSNFNNKESLLSPNIKSARISGGMIDNLNSGGSLSTRGSISNNQYPIFNFGPTNAQNPDFGRPKQDQMMIIQEIQEDDLVADRNNSQNNKFFGQINQSNQQSACNSPVRNENTNQVELTKKDIYVSFGNNKEATLHKAIQQVKNNQPNQQIHNNNINNNTNNSSSSGLRYIDNYGRQQQYDQRNIFNNNNNNTNTNNETSYTYNSDNLSGIYAHKTKPLTDIIEDNNMNEEDEKSQPNTPELMKDVPLQTQEMNSNNNNTEQQKAFRNLFGGSIKSPRYSKDDDEVIVTQDKQDELDNPLFSSPGYKQ
ncbi:hypothetical protein TTHERM_00777090 (macronuclear) [Tetrahymena thermophila SB210]|uniref:Uncharacterized protein n=1 Tax=Tetrahymena thermophila (strain SB210) TaxID=312017 RepID=Q23WU6_TETTS|nr:hypothetical protein TTHERM_00777090 [Tetrahymena thermophila SB210]EAS00999.1 hypothetical protein TTHERM_00777090 [Tetrahymena thermophila SB210]|eukprot:XP_001021244.1 hypothetical protein TTHERM_00777090 [Tetrahymena thermophila SB210]